MLSKQGVWSSEPNQIGVELLSEPSKGRAEQLSETVDCQRRSTAKQNLKPYDY